MAKEAHERDPRWRERKTPDQLPHGQTPGPPPQTDATPAHPRRSGTGAGHRARLRERFLRTGFTGFAEHEIVELLLTLCIPRADVKPAARALLARFKTLRGVLDADPAELRQVEGIGSVTPVALKIIREAATLYLRAAAEETEVLNSHTAIEDFWRVRLGHLKHEVFEIAYLDKAYRLLPNGVERLEEGVVDQTVVYPRKVMEAALRFGATHLVVAHNHPTGRLDPSKHDHQLTRALIDAGKPLGIRILDHVIVTRDGCYSFRRQGFLDT